MTVRLRLAIVSLFLAGFLSGALGPHCAAMFASPAAAAPHAGHGGHDDHHAPPANDDEAPCAAMTMPGAVLAEAAAPPRMQAALPGSRADAAALGRAASAVRHVRPPREKPPDPVGLRIVRTHRLLI